MKVSEKEYQEAVAAQIAAQEVINTYGKQAREGFEHRMKTNPIFTLDELHFSAEARCPCGAGLAYPKGCGMHHYWDCSAILLGGHDLSVKHCAQLPFSFYDVKSESEYRGTTRPKKETT